jgi:oligopeptide/dipeptide ABC transporter ATP-binding protein
MTAGDAPLVSVRDLSVEFRSGRAWQPAVRGVSHDIGAGERVGLVGESGSGKTASAMALLRLLPDNARLSGSVRFDGRDLLAAPERVLRAIRGDEASVIYQDPFSSLNPVLTVGRQVSEPLIAHRGLSTKEARRRAAELLARVGVPRPEERLNDYPHQFSGGMRQRVMIATALSTSPRFLIADEPTTALDVTVQAQILDVLREVTGVGGMSMLLITHDLGIVAGIADRVAVMYAGRVVEAGPTRSLFAAPAHPYTVGLLHSLPRIDARERRLRAIEGQAPAPGALPPGCPFAARCANRIDRCTRQDPPLMPVELAGDAARRPDEARKQAAALGDDVVPGPGRLHVTACWNPAQGGPA